MQPGADALLLGRFCFVTGNAASDTADPKSADVDGGRTTLRSPLFNLSELASPELHFTYWYSNDRGSNAGSDFFRVQISSDGGVSWVNLINTAASTDHWKPVTVRVPDFVTPTDRMLLQFVAEDGGPGSLVEAAVDDIFDHRLAHGARTAARPRARRAVQSGRAHLAARFRRERLQRLPLRPNRTR